MKQVGTITWLFLISIILTNSASITSAHIESQADDNWQEILEQHFDIVETFDELQNWSGDVHNGYSQDPNDMPKKMDGSPSIWGEYSDWTDAPEAVGDWIGPREDKYLWRGTGKSLLMTLRGPEGYGPSRMATYVGDGTPDSGYKDRVYAFFLVRAHDPYEESLDMTNRQWVPEGSSWRLASKNEWNPYIKLPAGLKVDGQWLYQRDRLYCDELEPGQWCKINQQGTGGVDDGINTLYVRLENDENPNEHTFSLYHWFLSLSTENSVAYMGVFKFFFIASGFTAIDYWGNETEHDMACGGNWGAQRKEIYGMNYQIFNMCNDYYGPGGPSALTLKDDITVSTYDEEKGCWIFQALEIENRKYSGVNFGPELLANKWMGIEIMSKRGSVDGHDGESEMWAYNEKGEIIGYQRFTDDNKVRRFDHAMNKFEFGGNKFGRGYFTDIADTYEGRYYIDDFILDDERIGPTYFSLLQSQDPPLFGDINLDGQVDTSDVQLCVSVMLGIEKTSDVIQSSDVNLDGKVDVLDIQAIANFALGN